MSAKDRIFELEKELEKWKARALKAEAALLVPDAPPQPTLTQTGPNSWRYTK